MIILGLDLGSTVGWCLHDTERPGETTYSHLDYSKLPRAERVVRFSGWLYRAIASDRPDRLAWEEVPGGQGSSTWVIQRQEGCCLHLCEQAVIPSLWVHQATLKSWAVGKGKGKVGKLEMRVAAEVWLQDWGCRPRAEAPNEHEADAILVTAWAIATCKMVGA